MIIVDSVEVLCNSCEVPCTCSSFEVLCDSFVVSSLWQFWGSFSASVASLHFFLFFFLDLYGSTVLYNSPLYIQRKT